MNRYEGRLGKVKNVIQEVIALPTESFNNHVFFLWKGAAFQKETSLMVPQGYRLAFIKDGRYTQRLGAGVVYPYKSLQRLLALSDSGSITLDVVVTCIKEYHDKWVNRERVTYTEPIFGCTYYLGMSGDYSVRVDNIKLFSEFCLRKNWGYANIGIILAEQSNEFYEAIWVTTQEYIKSRNLGRHEIDSSIREVGNEVKRKLNISVFNKIGIEVVSFSIIKHVHSCTG